MEDTIKFFLVFETDIKAFRIFSKSNIIPFFVVSDKFKDRILMENFKFYFVELALAIEHIHKKGWFLGTLTSDE